MAFSFGATPGAAPAAPSSGFGFGSPAPSAFGSTPSAQAPSTGFAFGSTTPAPSGGLFGGTPAPAPSFGSFGGAPASSSPFGQPASSSSPFGQPAQQQQQLMIITSSTPYASLPPEAKRAIDTIHDEIMRHKRTMNNVETMAPALLREPTVVNAADAAAGGGNASASNLQTRLQDLKHSLEHLQVTVGTHLDQLVSLQQEMQACTTQSVMYGTWPVEAVAVRRGVKLSSDKQSTDPSVQKQLQQLLDQQVSHVDRVERMPSPYMWQTLEDLQKRTETLSQQVSTLNRELDAHDALDHVMDIASIVHAQTEAIARVAHDVARVHTQMELLRRKYNQMERGENVLLKAEMAEYERQVRLEQQSKQQFMKAAGSTPQQQQQATAASAPSTGGLFGSTPAPSTGTFGAPAPAPTGGLFGSSPAPAPSTGFGASQPAPSTGLFGQSSPAPAPTGGLFGSTPAPAPSATPAPAPSTGFGSTPAPSTGLFGQPAPAPAPSGGLFGGAPAPAPVQTLGFSTSTPAAPATASTPRAKGSSSRSRNRSRR